MNSIGYGGALKWRRSLPGDAAPYGIILGERYSAIHRRL